MKYLREDAIAVVTKPRDKDEYLNLCEEGGFDIVTEFPVRNVTSGVLSDYKMEELASKVQELGVEKVLFDVSLKPGQEYNIAKATNAEVLDRVEVILEIFLHHAPTKEANLQVKLASLRHELARAKEKVRLSKKAEQPGFYGLGQYEVDVYYQEVQRRIQNIREKLQSIRDHRSIHRDRRKKKGFKTVSITGYTGSGKTTLFNKFTELHQKVGGEPFTTLSTKFSVLQLGAWDTYLVDTIGFISDVPPFLVNAFYSTLEELSFSDVILLVVDSAKPRREVTERFRTSYNQLIDLGVIDKPIIIVLNKIDEATQSEVEYLKDHFEDYTPSVVPVSALTGENVEKLQGEVEEHLGNQIDVEYSVPYEAGNRLYDFIDELEQRGRVEEVTNLGNTAKIRAQIPVKVQRHLGKRVNTMGGEERVV